MPEQEQQPGDHYQYFLLNIIGKNRLDFFFPQNAAEYICIDIDIGISQY